MGGAALGGSQRLWPPAPVVTASPSRYTSALSIHGLSSPVSATFLKVGRVSFMTSGHSKTFQDMLLGLERFWADRGCLISQPYPSEVGAGTFNPATFLRALGPEPWSVAFVEPSRRPKDGRYGENPNRLQNFYQYQVLLKPAPPDVLELDLFDEPHPAATNEATASTSAASSTPAFLLLTSYLLLGCPAPLN